MQSHVQVFACLRSPNTGLVDTGSVHIHVHGEVSKAEHPCSLTCKHGIASCQGPLSDGAYAAQDLIQSYLTSAFAFPG